MKILHTADWHIGEYKGPEKNGVNLRGKDIENCLKALIDHARTEKPDLTVVSGDIFNVAKLWSDKALPEVDTAIAVITELSEISPVCVLRGTPNHDGDGQFQLLSRFFEGYPNVYIFIRPKVAVVDTAAGKINVAALPGFDRGIFRAQGAELDRQQESEFFSKALADTVLGLRAQCDDSFPSVLLAHYTVAGANMESGQTAFMVQGDPVLTGDMLDAAGFNLVALGHIHRPQRVQTTHCSTYYSGAVNALNFNDEGQPRGFYVHDIKKDEHRFIELPYRKFKTISLDSDDIASLNLGNTSGVSEKWNNAVADKIVRVKYSCTDEQEKVLNKTALANAIYLDGAFYVSDILPDNIVIKANSTVLADNGDPEYNLKAYLDEKGCPAEQAEKIVAAARPIIGKALAESLTAQYHGRFEPVSISVKNYRNYAEETFDFSSVSFCTVNGPNGAGKSSLFSDAILDCLFEEPREGSNTGWISNKESAKSGSIAFTFEIGKKTFRVIRTRTKKSSRVTLNIAEYIDGQWENRSGEKVSETQNIIRNILGMDSTTLKSCSIIMQDGYGLFLETDTETRMDILSNILGISIYESMKAIAQDKASETDKNRRRLIDEAQALSANLQDEHVINEKIKAAEGVITQSQLKLNASAKEADLLKLQLHTAREAATRAEKIRERMKTAENKRSGLMSQKDKQSLIKENTEALLSQRGSIESGVQRYMQLIEQEKSLISATAAYDAKKAEWSQVHNQFCDLQTSAENRKQEKQDLMENIKAIDTDLQNEASLRADMEKYDVEKSRLNQMESAAGLYIRLSAEISGREKDYAAKHAVFREEAGARAERINALAKKAELLQNAGCVDPGNAHCMFLKDAKEAAQELPQYRNSCTAWKKEQQSGFSILKAKINALEKQRTELYYDEKALTSQRNMVSSLQSVEKRLAAMEESKKRRSVFTDRLSAVTAEEKRDTEKLSVLQSRDKALQSECSALQSEAAKAETVKAEIKSLEHYVEAEKQLPVAEEQHKTAVDRIKAIDSEISEINKSINESNLEYGNEILLSAKEANIAKQLADEERSLSSLKSEIEKYTLEIGGYRQTLESQQKVKESISEKQLQIKELASQSVILEELKKAFSRDGIPHNIVKSVLPALTAMANRILGQMSAGDMSVQFKTEKLLKSNAAKEVETLEVLIEENGHVLPYRSRSGGEKVKAALAVILTLAELKNSRSGVQLGMLFIDEPPFLDEDGVQAYCDALEAISRRNKKLKVMAITHDPAMKARFPQSIDIVKDAGGSHVRENYRMIA
jgi:exonuclease SbcD